MGFYESVRAVASAGGEGAIDWDAVGRAARESTDPGPLDLTAAQREGYAGDVADARDRLRAVTGSDFQVPNTVEVQHRHHWIDANVATFRRLFAPLDRPAAVMPGVTRLLNTGTMALSLSYLASNVLGQYDPLLLAEGGDDHALYFVHPNVVGAADSLGVDEARFRRWIAFHEVTHAAEFGMAPWLSGYLEERLREGMDALAEGRMDREALADLDAAMTVVEGYAEVLMDRAIDDDAADMRAKLDARRRGGGPVQRLVRRAIGLGLKRRQYERGKAFFEAVEDARGLDGAAAVWAAPENLPTEEELDAPEQWLARVDG